MKYQMQPFVVMKQNRNINLEAPLRIYHLYRRVLLIARMQLKHLKTQIVSGIARPGPTRACALPSPGQQDSHDSLMNTKAADVYPYMVSPAVLIESCHICAPFL